MAWIWPAVIDVAIAHATLCLLSLNRGGRATHGDPEGAGLDAVSATLGDGDAEWRCVDVDSERRSSARQIAQSNPSAVLQRGVKASPGTDKGAQTQPLAPSAPVCIARVEVLPALTAEGADAAPIKARAGSDSDALPIDRCGRGHRVHDWMPVAELLVRDGVTSKSAPLVAAILAENQAGTPPSTIGRRHEVHHTTVSRIVSAAKQLMEPSA